MNAPAALAALAAGAVVLLFAPGATARETTAPTITLLAPANGATILSSVTTTTYPTFSWHVDWATPEPTTVSWQIAADPSFTQKVTVDNHFCPADNVNCWTSIQPRSVYGPPYGSVWYWRVGLTTSQGFVFSPTFTFTAKNPPDVDRDGISDADDNCPTVANRDQRDSNHDRKGDACQPDRVRPVVRVSPGSGKRGHTLFFAATIGDDRGSVRLRVSMTYAGHLVLSTEFPWIATRRAQTETFYTKRPFPRELPAGTYQACVTAWDRAGNRSTACAPYRIA